MLFLPRYFYCNIVIPNLGQNSPNVNHKEKIDFRTFEFEYSIRINNGEAKQCANFLAGRTSNNLDCLKEWISVS